MISIVKPYLRKEEQDAVLAVLESGQIAQGARVAEFEDRFAAFCGVRHAVAVSSGTTALWLALLAHGIGPGDEVITTPFSFIATGNAVLYTGARPVFVDIDPWTFNLDPEGIESAITPRTRAILPVHLYGLPCDMERIMDIAGRHGLAIIEDAAQAHGAAVRGRPVGSFGTGCFSFYATKNMTTGEGGMVTTNDDAVADQVRMLRAHGMRRRYYHEQIGYNCRMTDIQAAIGLVQLTRLPELTARRQANADFLCRALAGVAAVIPPHIPTGRTHVFHQFTLRVQHGRDELRARLTEAGIGSEVYYPVPIPSQEVYRHLGLSAHVPIAEAAGQEVVSLPVHPSLSPSELEQIACAVAEAAAGLAPAFLGGVAIAFEAITNAVPVSAD
jgi:dTDP-4-amino-4,6-dideoxygalactose transaminase